MASRFCDRAMFASTYSSHEPPRQNEQENETGTCLGNRNIQVEIKRKYGACDQHNKNTKGCILKISQLHLHRSKLDTPANRRIRRWRLEAHRAPVRRLQILKMIHGLGVIWLAQLFSEYHQWIAYEQVCHMSRQALINPMLGKHIEKRHVVHKRQVIVLGSILCVGRNITIDRVIARLVDHEPIMLQWLQATLFARTIIHRGRNNVPATVRIHQIATVNRRGCRQSQLRKNASEKNKTGNKQAPLLDPGATGQNNSL